MKVALLTDGIYPYVMGGMQKHSYFLAKYFAKIKVNVDVYHYKPLENKTVLEPFSMEELKYINLIDIPYPKSRSFPGHYLYERYLYSKEIESVFMSLKKPDFIYAKGFAGWSLLKNKNKLKISIPIGVNFHGYEMFQKWPDFKTGMHLQILKLPVLYHMVKADFLFSYGGKISEIIKSKGFQKKIIEIPTGISSTWLKKSNVLSNNSTVKFVFVGRAERRKGIIEINKVIGDLKKSNFEFHFIGPIEDSLKLNKLNVNYYGPIYNEEEIKGVLDKMDVLVCPSYSEGMPNVIMEGMARGLAIIATNVGAVSLIVNKDNGWLLEGDIVSGLHAAMLDAVKCTNKELILKKENSIIKVRENFTWEKVIEKTIKALKI
jgi:glycosyltransferase involved in cell wall biosynthesis